MAHADTGRRGAVPKRDGQQDGDAPEEAVERWCARLPGVDRRLLEGLIARHGELVLFRYRERWRVQVEFARMTGLGGR
jgi:hypothetical protein